MLGFDRRIVEKVLPASLNEFSTMFSVFIHGLLNHVHDMKFVIHPYFHCRTLHSSKK